MTDRMECVAFLGERNFPKRIGTAVPRKDGKGWQVYLDAVPVGTWDGSFVIQPPRDREAAPQRRESDDTPW